MHSSDQITGQLQYLQDNDSAANQLYTNETNNNTTISINWTTN